MSGIELLENSLETFLKICCLSGEFREKTVEVLCEHEMKIEYDEIWNRYYFKINWERHRETSSLPSYIGSYGGKGWYKNGKKNREYDLPSYIYPSGEKYWSKDGEMYYPKKLK